jgi:hypothetical protein
LLYGPTKAPPRHLAATPRLTRWRLQFPTTQQAAPVKIAKLTAAVGLALSLSSDPGVAQAKPTAEKLAIRNCGQGAAGDCMTPGADVGKSQYFVDSC